MDGSYEGGQGVDVWWGEAGLMNDRLKALGRQGRGAEEKGTNKQGGRDSSEMKDGEQGM